MRQVLQSLNDGSISVPEVPEPALKNGGILVRSSHSVISTGTEGSSVEVARQSLLGKARRRPDLARQVISSLRSDGLRSTIRKVRDRLDMPKAPGYSLSGTVIEVAPDVTEFKIGDRVACAGEGYASHAETVFVPRNLAALVPAGVKLEDAAFATLGAIALHGVRQADLRLGETAVVIGLGPIGQLTCQIFAAAGVHVVGIDTASTPVERARNLGLRHALLRSDPVEETVLDLTQGHGADAVVISASTSTNDPIILAGSLSRDRGRVVLLGAVRADIPRSPYYEKELDLRMSRSYGPGRYDPEYEERGNEYPIGFVRWTENRNLAAFLDLVASGRVQVDQLISHRFAISDAAQGYQLLSADSRENVSVIALSYPKESPPPSRFVQMRASATPAAKVASRVSKPAIGFIGAGSFARTTLFPIVKKLGLPLTGVATSHPHTAHHMAQKFGFAHATTRPEEVFSDPDTDIVVIATRHDSHAHLAAGALTQGKAVFVEKPLALNSASLKLVLEAQAVSGAPLCVGFNRRFAPLLQKMLEALPFGVPRTIQIRVNAGALSPHHWLLDPVVGGGRLLGEGCHFFDLALYMAGSMPTAVHAAGDENEFTGTVRFDDGSLASVVYTARGSKKLPKERIEVFSGGVSAVLDDFRRLQIDRERRRHIFRARDDRKGHRALFSRFVDSLQSGTSLPISLAEIRTSHELTFQMAATAGHSVPPRLHDSPGHS